RSHRRPWRCRAPAAASRASPPPRGASRRPGRGARRGRSRADGRTAPGPHQRNPRASGSSFPPGPSIGPGPAATVSGAVKAILLTREYPPDVYGGAGVHVEYLARELARRIDLEVRCFGEPREGAKAFLPWEQLDEASSALQTMSVDLAMAERGGADIVHSHTWYANFGGHLTKLLHGVPHVLTTHSLEPMRPWKAEQLGAGGYALSSFCERTGIDSADAVIAVSAAMRDDVRLAYPEVDPGRIEVIYNGIDTEQYRPDPGIDALERHGVSPHRPIRPFVGRITR